MRPDDLPDLSGLRLPPNSSEAEQAVLGGLLLSNAAFDRIADLVEERDFYRADHRIIWRTIVRLIEDAKPADVLTVADLLKGAGEMESAGGLGYLQALAQATPSAANIRRYAEIVRERAVRRSLIEAATTIIDQAYDASDENVEEIADRAQATVMGATRADASKSLQPVSAVMLGVMERLDARGRGAEPMVRTDLVDLDKHLLNGGMRFGRLYVFAGRPSSGKSVLLTQLAEASAAQGVPAALFTMEMPAEENGERILAAASRVQLDRILEASALESQDWDRMGEALGRLQKLPLYIDETPSLRLAQLRGRIRAAHRSHGVRAAFIDYIQLLKPDGKHENRNDAVTEICAGLKAIAKELDIVVVGLSQLNRKCEDRPNKRGQMADLEGSNGLEANADVIGFIYRDEMYQEDSPDRGTAEIIIRKNRGGRPGTVRTTFEGQYSRFENLAFGWAPQPGHARKTSRRLGAED